MALLFRGIGNKAWWDKGRDEFSWLGEGELVADVLKSLGTVNGALSIYAIDQDKAKIDRVVAALASGRDRIQNFDYMLVPMDVVKQNFLFDNSVGQTPDAEVNEWHLDIVHLTPAKLMQLAYVFSNHKESLRRMPKKDVKSALRTSMDNGFLDMHKVKVAEELG